ncbi:MAG: lysylphosphatidylglycerol synthase transmembrane domain-containing protein, partial [Terriglobales bacterium]
QNVNPVRVATAIAIIYFVYLLRALRWKIFLRPVRKTSTLALTPATIIGFTGLALLGRPGELIRPYLVARREQLPFSSQMGVWLVERIFDTGAFTVLVTLNIFFAPGLSGLPYSDKFPAVGAVLVAVVLGLTAMALLIWRNGAGVARWTERALSRFSERAAKSAAQKVQAFGKGLHTIHDVASFAQLVVVSLAIWLLIAIAFREVTHAYPEPLRHMTVPHVVLLMGFSIAGSAVQLPAVGGGSQLATIAALHHIFNVPSELAVSCGILLWLVTFVSVTPAGLFPAHREHVSLRKLSVESEEQADDVVI